MSRSTTRTSSPNFYKKDKSELSSLLRGTLQTHKNDNYHPGNKSYPSCVPPPKKKKKKSPPIFLMKRNWRPSQPAHRVASGYFRLNQLVPSISTAAWVKIRRNEWTAPPSLTSSRDVTHSIAWDIPCSSRYSPGGTAGFGECSRDWLVLRNIRDLIDEIFLTNS